jgi:hypothetical protein
MNDSVEMSENSNDGGIINNSEELSDQNETNVEPSQAGETQEESQQQASDSGEEVKQDSTAERIPEDVANKIRSIAEKKTARKLRKEYEAKLAELTQAQPAPAQQQQYIPPQTDPNTTYDPTLEQWIRNDMPIAEYVELAAQLAQSNPRIKQNIATLAQQQSSVQQPQQPQSTAPKIEFSDEAENQAIECEAEFSDFSEVLKGVPIHPEVVNELCADSAGMKNLYHAMKESPHEIYKILKLPLNEQKYKMWQMNQEVAKKKAAKVKSNATEQAAPLKNGGDIHKQFHEMSEREQRKSRWDKNWDGS